MYSDRSQERKALHVGTEAGHDEKRWQVLKTLLWPWLWCQDTGWLTSKCDFITGVQRDQWVDLKAQELHCCFQLQGKLLHFCFLIHGLQVWARILPKSLSTMVICDSKILGRYLEQSCASMACLLQVLRKVFLF